MAIKGLSTYGRSSGYMSTASLPDAKKEYVVSYERLDGGLNISEMEYRLGTNESPEMKNLLWIGGALGCRNGQSWLSEEKLGVGYTCFEELFWGNMFFHIGTKLYFADPAVDSFTLTELISGVPAIRGTFFRYQEYLFYKTKGAYIRVSYSATAPHFTAAAVPAYTPVTYINCVPRDGSGDSYQPENRISSRKTQQYNAATTDLSETFTGDSATLAFVLDYTSASQARLSSVDSVYIGATLQPTTAYTVSLSTGTVTFTTAPTSGAVITVLYSVGVYEYYLPVVFDSIIEVTVDGVALASGVGYTAYAATKKIVFTIAPPVTNPATNNTVVITYSKANTDAYNSIMDCPYAKVYGGNQNVCVVVAGCPAQPNAYFWTGNHTVMDAGYFPMLQYNLAGDTEEAITGFGKQQDYLVILKESSVGRATMSVVTVDERDVLELPYTQINSRIGCDCPWTIQLVSNNLVWCNSKQGVHYLRDSSAAYENNVICLSTKINSSGKTGGTADTSILGLLHDLREAGGAIASSVDDGERYWVVTNGNAFVWDYTISSESKPSWFFFTGIHAVAFCIDDEMVLRHLNADGQVSEMGRSFSDYDGAIEKVYQFPAQNFGNYNQYKNITGVIFVVRSDTDTLIDVIYKTDWENRADLTPIVAYSWRLFPRNLLYRFLGVVPFATVARRQPGCKNIRHFSMRLENETVGNDLSVVSAQIFYNFQGRQR